MLRSREIVQKLTVSSLLVLVQAGITFWLQNSGYQVTILEGRERPGGRIQTQRFGDVEADLGAAWIHGDFRQPIMKLAEKYSLETSPTN